MNLIGHIFARNKHHNAAHTRRPEIERSSDTPHHSSTSRPPLGGAIGNRNPRARCTQRTRGCAQRGERSGRSASGAVQRVKCAAQCSGWQWSAVGECGGERRSAQTMLRALCGVSLCDGAPGRPVGALPLDHSTARSLKSERYGREGERATNRTGSRGRGTCAALTRDGAHVVARRRCTQQPNATPHTNKQTHAYRRAHIRHTAARAMTPTPQRTNTRARAPFAEPRVASQCERGRASEPDGRMGAVQIVSGGGVGWW